MKKLKKYINNQEINSNLTREELLELKKLLKEIPEKEFLGTRSKECYLWEIDKKLAKEKEFVDKL